MDVLSLIGLLLAFVAIVAKAAISRRCSTGLPP
jgi:hypothetical protein